MYTSILSAAALLAACAHAIQITAPTKDQVVDLSEGFQVSWSTVSSDPTSAHLFLVNMASGHTPYSKDLGEVDLTKGGIKVTQTGVPADTGYQFNVQSVSTQNTGILAQSEQFEVKESSKPSDASDSSSNSSSSASASASTATETTATAASSSGSGSGSAASETSTATTMSTATSSTGTATATKSTSTANASSTPTSAAAANTFRGSLLAAAAVGLVAVLA
jgi:cobalamin biosynthesis Mg chelatase CobN